MTDKEVMDFPNNIYKFLIDYSFKDSDKVYTNGILLIPTFRAKQAIEHYFEQTRWIPVSEDGYPKSKDEYKHFITIDDKGEITIQEFLLSLDEEPQPYFSGMRNIVAYMPLPEPYKIPAQTFGCAED